MNQKELEKFRQQLLDLGKRIQGDVAGLADEALRRADGEASGNLSDTPLHLADLGTDTYVQEVSLSLLETERGQLAEITRALERVAAGTFGVCEECGREIAKERLQALPYTRLCIECANRADRRQA